MNKNKTQSVDLLAELCALNGYASKADFLRSIGETPSQEDLADEQRLVALTGHMPMSLVVEMTQRVCAQNDAERQATFRNLRAA